MGASAASNGGDVGRSAGRLAAVVLCLAAVVGTGSMPAVASWPVVGALKVWVGGVPSRLGAGGTLDLTVYYSQDSPDTLRPLSFGVILWNTSSPGDVVPRTVSATWLNPVTQSWQEPSATEDNGTWTLSLSDSQPLMVPPNTTASVRVKLTFAPSAHPGLYRLQAMPAVGSRLFTPQGADDYAMLNPSWPQYDIAYATTAAAPTPRTTRTASAGQSPKPLATAVPSLAGSASSTAAPAAVSITATGPASASATPVAPPVEMAAHTTRSESGWPYLAAAAATGVLLAAGGYPLWRRRRRSLAAGRD